MNRYQPSQFTNDRQAAGKLWPCRGLSSLVKRLRGAGYVVAIDLSDGELPELEEVNSQNVVRAVNEVDVADLHVSRDGHRVGGIVVIPSNDEDWLCDYSYRRTDLEFPAICEEAVDPQVNFR